MKIGLISSFALKSPPTNYGGLERVWADFAKGLGELGHDVTLVAARGSKKIGGYDLLETVESWDSLNPAQQQQYVRADGIQRTWNQFKWFAHTHNGWRAHEEEAYPIYRDKIGSVDVVGDASWSKCSYLNRQKEEIIGTCHSIKSYVTLPRKYSLFTGVSNPHSRFLSSQYRAPIRTLWNPVDVSQFDVQRDKSDRVLSLNRIMPQKGIHIIVNLAEKHKWKTDIAGDDSTLVQDQNYVSQIKQKCAQSAVLTYHGLVDEKKKKNLLANAKVLVCFVDVGYQEVFGLMAVEALASGTPVVALRSWGFEDIIENEKNGFLCDNPDQVADAVNNILSETRVFDPMVCRQSAERFSIANSTKRFEKMLQAVKNGCRW